MTCRSFAAHGGSVVVAPRERRLTDLALVPELDRADGAKSFLGQSAQRSTVHPQDAARCAASRAARRLTRLTVQPAEDVCKRRDAVRLGRIEAALPPGAGSGVLSGATVSWAAPRQFVPLTLLLLWAHCRRRHVDSRVAKQVAEPQSRSHKGYFLPVGRILPRRLRRLDALPAQVTRRSRYSRRLVRHRKTAIDDAHA